MRFIIQGIVFIVQEIPFIVQKVAIEINNSLNIGNIFIFATILSKTLLPLHQKNLKALTYR